MGNDDEPFCGVCITRMINEFQAEGLRISLGQKGLPDPVLLKIAEACLGDGYEDLCRCGGCLRAWLAQGWICPEHMQMCWWVVWREL